MKIEIPKEYWYIKRGDEDLAYVTYYEKNAAFEKRKATGTSWAHGYRGNKIENEPVIITNELLSGYKIIDKAVRWVTDNIVWRIRDPRGFEFEIYSGNMMEIIKCAEIKNGEILTKCILGREGGKNVLLPETSEPYRIGVEFTSKKDNKIKVKDINVGDIITLKNSNKYIYLGSYYGIYVDHHDYNGKFEPKCTVKKYFFVKSTDKKSFKIDAYAALNIIEVEPKNDNTDYKKYVNDYLTNIEGYHYTDITNVGYISAVCDEIPTQLSFELVDGNQSELHKQNGIYNSRLNYSYLINDKFIPTESYSNTIKVLKTIVNEKTKIVIETEPKTLYGRDNGVTYTRYELRESINTFKRIALNIDGVVFSISRFH